MDIPARLHTVAETRAFSRDADALLTPDERERVILELAHDPQGGDVIVGTGGLRKRRVPLQGRGKRGGARLITFFLGQHWPVYAVYLYAKNERQDLSPQQKKALMHVVADISQLAMGRRNP